MTSFEKFGNNFQLRLFYYLITDVEFAASILEILKPQFFTNIHYQTLMQMIILHYEKYHIIPSFDILETKISSELHDEIEQEYLIDLLKRSKLIATIQIKNLLKIRQLNFVDSKQLLMQFKIVSH